MTQREGSSQALREMGYTEDEIAKRQKYADEKIAEMFGPAFVASNRNRIIPPEREREFIDGMKLIFATTGIAHQGDPTFLNDVLHPATQ